MVKLKRFIKALPLFWSQEIAYASEKIIAFENVSVTLFFVMCTSTQRERGESTHTWLQSNLPQRISPRQQAAKSEKKEDDHGTKKNSKGLYYKNDPKATLN